jgi:hypothetical protein
MQPRHCDQAALQVWDHLIHKLATPVNETPYTGARTTCNSQGITLYMHWHNGTLLNRKTGQSAGMKPYDCDSHPIQESGYCDRDPQTTNILELTPKMFLMMTHPLSNSPMHVRSGAGRLLEFAAGWLPSRRRPRLLMHKMTREGWV